MNQEEFAKNNIIPLLASEQFHFTENKTPFNYINYWNYINDEYFQRVNEKTISNTAQIVHKIISNGNSFFLNLLNFITLNFIERPEIQTKRLNLISVQNKMELTTLNIFLKSKPLLYNIFSSKIILWIKKN